VPDEVIGAAISAVIPDCHRISGVPEIDTLSPSRQQPTWVAASPESITTGQAEIGAELYLRES
jgi:hypothetical protein